MGGRWQGIILSLVATVVVAEAISALGLRVLGRTVYFQSPEQAPPRTEKDPWGAWGVPNTVSRSVAACFDVQYKFNDVGARDNVRQIESNRRWIVLGDSLLEGYNIKQSERLSSLLEESSGWEFANFASAGDFGPLQYFLVYRGLAKKFEHYGVIVGFSLSTDFTDNDPEWWKHRSLEDQYRYRPYSLLSADNQSYKIIYGVNGDAKPRNEFNVPPPVPHRSLLSTAIIHSVRRLSKISATFSLLRQMRIQRIENNLPLNRGAFTDDRREISIAKLALHDLSREIGTTRPKIILLLQMQSDLIERRRRGAKYSDEVSRFLDDLRLDGWTIIDTADILKPDDDISLSCDRHWNATTNRRVAEFILKHYGNYLTGKTRRSEGSE